ncbi:MAG: hypothetical protein KatS3mg131_3238 [Candidatus Tectimicrobiota bacterium]|nr:MAG: hypothetical protein KatS3mg131_3238 [Candidatus Tectomicrobia bacterium]
MVHVQALRAGWARLQSLRAALQALTAAGKVTLAYLEQAGNKEYFLATACSAIVLAPSATLNLLGLRAEVLFFKGALARLGVQAELEAVGEYKTAAEPFTRDGMSPAHREALEALLDDLYAQFLDALATGRRLSLAQMRERCDQGPYTAVQALAAGLVDHLAYPDDVEALLAAQAGRPLRPLPALAALRPTPAAPFWGGGAR